MSGDQHDPAIDNTLWKLKQYGSPDAPATPVRQATATFRDQTMSGTTGCNRYSATFSRDNDRFAVGSVITTRMFCAGVMDQEQAFLAALQSARSLVVAENRLVITYDGGVLEFVVGPPPA